MKTFVAIASLLIASAVNAHAEPRWCSITGKGPNDKVFYPPIAKAARVSGVILSHIIYERNGKVLKVEKISGPPLLAMPLEGQLTQWTVKTDALGDQLCQTLVIAKFGLNSEVENPPPDPTAIIDSSISSILLLDFMSTPTTPVSIGDPIGRIVFNNPFRQFAYEVKRGFRQIFHRQQ